MAIWARPKVRSSVLELPAPSLGALGKRRKGQPKCFRPSGGAAGRNSVYPGSLGVEMGKRVELRELMKPEIIRCCIEAYTSSTVRTATPLYRAALSLSYHSLQPFNWTVRILSHTRRLINDCSRWRDSSRPVGSSHEAATLSRFQSHSFGVPQTRRLRDYRVLYQRSFVGGSILCDILDFRAQ
jgi:hypothetical protein